MNNNEELKDLLALLQNSKKYINIISRDGVLNKVMKELSELHTFKITPPSKNGGRWQTYVKENGIRKCIKASTEEVLYKKLLEFYTSTNFDNLTFDALFNEWLEYKKGITTSSNTIIRHRQRYKKYFKNSKLNSVKVSKIDELTLEQICNDIVKSFNLTRKEWVNAKAILNGMFEYAYRKQYIKVNPISHIKITVKYRQLERKTGKSQTFNTDEQRQLFEYLDKMYAETNDTAFLAIKLNFKLGLRVGELAVLKWDDVVTVDDKPYIHIVREEVLNKETHERTIANHTKGYTDRYVNLSDSALEILNQVERTSEFIFVRDGKHLTTRQLSYVLEKYAERMGIQVKSSHKMRKTFASNLNASGVPLDAISLLLGHQEKATTLSYLYNPLTDDETFDLINKAL